LALLLLLLLFLLLDHLRVELQRAVVAGLLVLAVAHAAAVAAAADDHGFLLRLNLLENLFD